VGGGGVGVWRSGSQERNTRDISERIDLGKITSEDSEI
jgi:hypothetical protein